MKYVQAIGAGRAECSSTRCVSDTTEWSEVSQHATWDDALYKYTFSLVYFTARHNNNVYSNDIDVVRYPEQRQTGRQSSVQS